MIIAVTHTGCVELRDTANFRAFKILDQSGNGPDQLAAALSGLATLTPDGTAAWVEVSAVPRLLAAAPTPQWEAAFDAMIALARKHGWVDGATGAVRAHIERVETT